MSVTITEEAQQPKQQQHSSLPLPPMSAYTSLPLETKVRLLTGSSFHDTANALANATTDSSLPHLGVVRLADGPTDGRASKFRGERSVVIPSPSAMAALWDPEHVERLVSLMIDDARATKGIDCALAPTVNLHRDPRAGRNAECFSEDPVLTSACARAWIRAAQRKGTGACIKHLVCNDSETQRKEYIVEVDQRTLREVYLRPFEDACSKNGDDDDEKAAISRPWSLMTAYNGVNGLMCASHHELVTKILREEWRYDGLVMSDWFGTYDTVGPMVAGVDLEMPFPIFRGQRLIEAVKRGNVDERKHIDPAVERLVTFVRRCNPAQERQLQIDSAAHDDVRDATLRQAVAESCVVLKNDDDILPLEPASLRSVAVIGQMATADTLPIMISPVYIVKPLEGVQRAGKELGFDVIHAPGVATERIVTQLDRRYASGIDIKLWAGKTMRQAGASPWAHDADVQEASKVLMGDPKLAPSRDVASEWDIEITATLSLDVSGTYVLGTLAAGACEIAIDGETRLTHRPSSPVLIPDMLFGRDKLQRTMEISLEAGRAYSLRACMHSNGPLGNPELSQDFYVLLERKIDVEPAIVDAVAAAREADVALCFVGLSRDWEMEGTDRETIELAQDQQRMIREVVAANPRTIVVNQSGGAIDLRFAQEAKAIVHAHLGGQETGNGIADMLFGRTDPNGRAPYSFAARTEDLATYDNFPCRSTDEGKTVLHYAEGLLNGYKWHGRKGPKALYPFGHGLSYTTFAWSNFSLTGTPSNGIRVAVTVTNTGKRQRQGRDVVQIYVQSPDDGPQSLEGFAKTSVLAPGASETLDIHLSRRAFAHWDQDAYKWKVASGKHEVLVAKSADDVVHSIQVNVEQEISWGPDMN